MTGNRRQTGPKTGIEAIILLFQVPETHQKEKNKLPSGLNQKKKKNVMNDIVYDNLEMNLINKKVLLNKIEVPLTKKEFDLLRLFLENRNHLFTRKEILSHIWSSESDVSSRTIDVNVMRLRNKIGTYETKIVTRLGYGYSFEE